LFFSVRRAGTGFDSPPVPVGDSSLCYCYDDVIFMKKNNKNIQTKNSVPRRTCKDHGGLVLFVKLVDGYGVVQHRPARHINISLYIFGFWNKKIEINCMSFLANYYMLDY
jgi:hypothetical protein